MVSSPSGSSSNMAIPEQTTTFLSLFDAIGFLGNLLKIVNHRKERLPCDAVYSPLQPRSVRLAVFNPGQLFWHRRYSTRTMAERRYNVLFECILWQVLLH